MALINTAWNHASLHPVLLKSEILIYSEENQKFNFSLLNYDDFKQTLLKSKREFINLKLCGLKTSHLNDISIFFNLGMHIKSLYLSDLRILTDHFLDSITSYCYNLKSLSFQKIAELSFSDISRTPLFHLNSIHFNNMTLNDKNFNIIIKCAPNLNDLSFKLCPILNGLENIALFYPNYRNNEISTNFNSNYVFTDVNIVQYLKTAKHINSLQLEQCSHIFFKLPKHIKLKCLILEGTNSIYTQEETLKNNILTLTEHNTLEKLHLICFPCCSLSQAISKLHNLIHLTVRFSSSAHTPCKSCLQTFVDKLSLMKHIRTLTIRHWLDDDLEVSQIYLIPDCVLKSLTALKCSINNSLQLINFGKNLTRLHIYNGQILSDNDFQLIFKNLTNLRHLLMEHCIQLNDDVLLCSPVSNLKGNKVWVY